MCALQVLAHGGMGYAQEYHVERYFRECLVPRIAPVSRVSFAASLVMGEMVKWTNKMGMPGDDTKLCQRESIGVSAKLLSGEECTTHGGCGEG